MKRVIGVGKLAAGIAVSSLIIASVADGSSNTQQIHYAGYWCKTGTQSRSIACVPVNGKGYSFGISRDVVLVMRGKRTVIAGPNN